MATARTPAERAIADVEKAIKNHDTTLEKAEAAQKKADEAVAKANRADRELQWFARHPDLPDEFDLDEFRKSLEEPFADDDTDPVLPDEGEVAAVAEGEADVAAGRVTEVTTKADAIVESGPADDDDPWADDEA